MALLFCRYFCTICTLFKTSNFSKAYVTRDSIGPAIWAISVQRAIN